MARLPGTQKNYVGTTTIPSGRRTVSVIALVSACFFLLGQQTTLGQVLALQGTPTLVGNNVFAGSLGMDFVVNAPGGIDINSLGVFDDGQNGINASNVLNVALWSRNDNGTPNDPTDDTAGSILSSNSFSNGSAGTLNGVYRTKNVTSPLHLSPGSYSIVSWGYGADEKLGNNGEPGSPGLPTINTSAGAIQFVGAGRFNATPGDFPNTVDTGPANRYFAGTFGYTPPAFDSLLSLQINRATGEMSLANGTASAARILGYSVTSPLGALTSAKYRPIAGTRDSAGTGMVDNNDMWTVLSHPSDRTDLSEFELFGGDGANLTSLQSVPLNVSAGSGPWIRNPFESDVTFKYTLQNGTIVDGVVKYTGNGGTAYKFGDLNFDGTAFSLSDFTSKMLPNLVSNPTLSAAECYALGDLDLDTDIDQNDFRIFKQGYIAAGFPLVALNAAIAAVPEPSSLMLFGMANMTAILLWRGKSNRRVIKGATLLLLALVISESNVADAQIVALQSPSPLTGNHTFGGNVGMDFNVTEFPIQIQSLGFFDSGQNGILGAGTNIHVEIWNRSGTPTLVSGASQTFTSGSAGALSGGSRFKATTPLVLQPGNYSIVAGGFNSTDPFANTGQLPGVPAPIINDGGGLIKFVGSGRFSVSGEAGVFPGSPDGGPANRYNAGTFQYALGVTPLTLEVNRSSGAMSIRNPSTSPFNIDFYEITSTASSLNPSWTGIPQSGWLGGGASNAKSLSEANLTSSTLFPATSGVQTIGNAYNTSVGAQDLIFKYTTASGITMQGNVTYLNSPTLGADFNGNGTVNGADLPLWQTGYGTDTGATRSNGDADADGDVDGRDFLIWQRQFGSSSPLVSTVAVPEPNSAFLLLSAVVGISSCNMRRKRSKSSQGSSQAITWFTVVSALVLLIHSSASATLTNDRVYRMGDDPAEHAATDTIVGSGAGNVAPGKTLDSAGPGGNPTFQDLQQFNGPTYVNVSTGPSARPGATAGSRGIQFDGIDDYLQGRGFGLPETTASATGGGLGGTLDYSGITNRGFQLWVKPSGAAMGIEQDVINDTFQHGVRISNNNTWVMRYSNVFYDSGIPVSFDNWTHIMVERANGANVGSRMYVNGIGVAAAFGGYNFNDPFSLVVGGSVGNGFDDVDGQFNHFAGQVDDLKMFLVGTSTNTNTNYGTFNYATDNDYVVQMNLLTGVAGDVNQDGVLNNADAVSFTEGWKSQKLVMNQPTGDVQSYLNGDLNFDGVTNQLDAFLLHQAFAGSPLTDLTFRIPEPAAISLLSCMLICIYSCRGNRFRSL